MFTKDSLIFLIDDDEPYGKLIQTHIQRQGFGNVVLFQDERSCLLNIIQHPHVLITDYHLNYMSGLKLIEQARKIIRSFYSILLSGVYHNEIYSDDMSIRNVDKYIIKGENDLNQLSETLHNFLIPECCYQFY
jgi:ActR/RegA family two-component response regulator